MMTKKKKSETVTVTKPIAFEDTVSVGDLRASLEEVKTYDGVIGYILRNSSSASIDLRDPTKIIDYAILSSSAFDFGAEFSELFDLGDVSTVIVEGKAVKMLSLVIGEHKVGIFMEKNTNSDRILEKLHAS
jgi:predicted regulator of Ras-like GTPase activity (Roadblock/LC7/MglB family)